ncbi:MAG: DUF5683 domain-containing protein, partial [Bacteroidales bacterium]
MQRFLIILILFSCGLTGIAQNNQPRQVVTDTIHETKHLLKQVVTDTIHEKRHSPKQVIPDSILEKQHSPKKATLMSLCLPGLGQIYNKKYWKVPIIYAGFGILSYLIVFNTNYYLTYKSAYIESFNGDSSGSYSDIVRKYPASSILSAREYYRRNLEISIIFTAVLYILNITDAAVDANLFTYDIKKDLSFKVEPTLIPPAPL